MKNIIRTFIPFYREIKHDFMLAACILSPILIGAAFRFLLPLIEKLLCRKLGVPQIFTPYYVMLDLLLLVMAPVMLCFSGVLVILEETDCSVAKYYAVTPVGKWGYLSSRILLPALIGFFYNLALIFLFGISGLNALMALFLSLCGSVLALITSLIVVTYAGNKMEGMALVKLCGILIAGIPVSFLVTDPVRYVCGFMPSFWMAELCRSGNYWYLIPALFSSAILLTALYRCYLNKKLS